MEGLCDIRPFLDVKVVANHRNQDLFRPDRASRMGDLDPDDTAGEPGHKAAGNRPDKETPVPVGASGGSDHEVYLIVSHKSLDGTDDVPFQQDPFDVNWDICLEICCLI